MALRLIPDQVDQLKSNEKARAEGASYAGLYVLVVNSKVPPLDNPKVKQALSLAIDRDGDRQEPLARPGLGAERLSWRQGDAFYDPSRTPFEYDPDKAKALLRGGRLQGRGGRAGEQHDGRQRSPDVRGDRRDVEEGRRQRQDGDHRGVGARREEPREVVQGPVVVRRRPPRCRTRTA